MNLIEQLGGYEKVKLIVSGALDFTHIDIYDGAEYFIYEKQAHSGCINNVLFFNPRTKRTGVIFIQGGLDSFGAWHISIDEIKSDLLEYRRHHDIFEIGDKVVSINSAFIEYEGVLNIDFIDRFDLMLSDESKGFEVNAICGWSIIIRHATNVEIEAGCKL